MLGTLPIFVIGAARVRYIGHMCASNPAGCRRVTEPTARSYRAPRVSWPAPCSFPSETTSADRSARDPADFVRDHDDVEALGQHPDLRHDEAQDGIVRVDQLRHEDERLHGSEAIGHR